MENLLQGIEGVAVYIDDILVTGSTVDEHICTLDKVQERIESAGLTLDKSKCYFLRSRIEYLGYITDEEGLRPTAEKVKAISEAPEPKNVAELHSFLGMINYYGRFLPNMSTQLAPLYRLLRKDVQWSWTNKQNKAIEAAKKALQTDSLLVHYDSSKPLLLACDASQYGLGAVLSHVFENSEEQPIAFMSRTLMPAEKNYSQLEREGLVIIFGMQKFHKY